MRNSIFLSLALVLMFSITGCWMNSPSEDENRPPYEVTAAFTSRYYAEDTGLQTFQLAIDEQNGLKDPDGDTVYFRSSNLPAWISLDADTGVVTVDTVDSHSAEDFQFWSEDEHGADTSGTAYTVTISVSFS